MKFQNEQFFKSEKKNKTLWLPTDELIFDGNG